MKRRAFLSKAAALLAVVPAATVLAEAFAPVKVTRVLVMDDKALKAIDVVGPIDWEDSRIYGVVNTRKMTREQIDREYGVLAIDHG